MAKRRPGPLPAAPVDKQSACINTSRRSGRRIGFRADLVRRLFNGLLAGLLIAFCGSGGSTHARQPEGEAATPPPVGKRLEALDRSISNIRVAPDGRLWSMSHTFTLNDEKLDREGFKRFVERNFHDPQPQVRDAGFALLDDRCRAWFYYGPHWELLGYDGRRWYERANPNDGFLRAECPTRGQWTDDAMNQSVGGVCYFPSQFGVHQFDGEQWTYQEIGRNPPAPGYPVRLTASPDGRFIVACRAPADGFWARRDGRWSRLPMPIEASNGVRSFIVTDAGVVWCLTTWYDLHRFSLDDGSPVERFAPLVAELAAATFERREAATAELIGLSPFIKTELEQATARATDAEVRRRLAHVNRHAARIGPRPPQPFFDRELREPWSLYQDQRGRLIVPAAEIDGQGPAVMIVHPDGRTEVVVNPDVAWSLRRHYSGACAPIAAPEGDAVWCEMAARGAVLFDLTEKKIVAEVDDHRLSRVRGVGADGRPFVAPRISSDPILVFDSRVPDARVPLRVVTSPSDVDFMRVAGDGAIWARHSEKEFSRFDGRTWERIDLPTFGEIHFAAGAEGLVIVGSKGGSYSLYQGNQLVDRRRTLVGLIERRHELVAEAFRRSRAQPDRAYDSIGMVADRDKNIWIRHDNRISVLTTEGRRSTAAPLIRAGAKVAPGSQDLSWTLMTQAGDGGDVYLSNEQQPYQGGQSFRGRVEKGAVTFQETFHSLDPAVRASSGEIWIGGLLTEFHDTYVTIWGDRAVRLDGDQPETEVKYHGRPFLVDRSGHVWLRRRWPRPDGRVSIWHDGRIRQELRLPATDEIHAAFSDRPGSVYLWIARGLQHLVADPRTGDYRPGALYSMPGLRGDEFAFDYSPLGYFAVAGYTELPERKKVLSLFELPKP